MKPGRTKTIMDQYVGPRVRQARKNIGIGIVELGRQCEVSNQTINRVELGHCSPSLGLLHALCLSLNVSSDWLLGINND